MTARITSGPASKQDYATPREFMAAVEARFGPIAFDLAAHADNAKARRWFGPGGDAEDALAEPWHDLITFGDGLLWLNPPFADIAPWAAKCAREANAGANILLLVPAAVGSNWFRDHVFNRAAVYLLNGRLSFDGKAPYPKDCLLAHYGETPHVCVWDWRAAPRAEQLALGGKRG